MKQTPIEAVFRSASGRFIAGVTVRRVATASAEGVPSKEKQPCLDDVRIEQSRARGTIG